MEQPTQAQELIEALEDAIEKYGYSLTSNTFMPILKAHGCVLLSDNQPPINQDYGYRKV